MEQFHSNTNRHSFIHDIKSSKNTEILPHEEEAAVDAVGWTGDGNVLVLSDLGSEFSHKLCC